MNETFPGIVLCAVMMVIGFIGGVWAAMSSKTYENMSVTDTTEEVEDEQIESAEDIHLTGTK
jgi:uncharacterized membrane protein YqjE